MGSLGLKSKKLCKNNFLFLKYESTRKIFPGNNGPEKSKKSIENVSSLIDIKDLIDAGMTREVFLNLDKFKDLDLKELKLDKKILFDLIESNDVRDAENYIWDTLVGEAQIETALGKVRLKKVVNEIKGYLFTAFSTLPKEQTNFGPHRLERSNKVSPAC